MGTYKEEAARREGMSYALNIAKKKGIKALEEELNRDCRYGIRAFWNRVYCFSMQRI